MGRRGGFSHSYDATATYGLLADPEAVAALGDEISASLAFIDATIDRIAQDLITSHGLNGDVARLLVAQRTADAVDFLRWVKAGEARAAGIPVPGLMHAMGYSSPTSISRRVAELDHVVAVRAHVDATGAEELVADDRGYTLTLRPREDGVDTVTEARKRGILAD